MYEKTFTDLNKTSYLCCCDGVRLLRVLPPLDENSKARFLLQAPSEGYLTCLEAKWDKPNIAGNPGISNARKLLFKRKELAVKAIQASERHKPL